MTDITEDNRHPWPRSEDLGTPISLKVMLSMLCVELIDSVIAWQQRASQRYHLSGLDDHLLKDMGISRADVEREVTKPFWRV